MNLAARTRALSERYGRRTLIALALIAVLGLGLRAYAVARPVADPADDSHAYYGLAAALYEEGSYGGPNFRDSSDWSPGAPLLYAAAFFVTGGPREGTARIVEALLGTAAILVVFALAVRLADGGRDPRRRPVVAGAGGGHDPEAGPAGADGGHDSGAGAADAGGGHDSEASAKDSGGGHDPEAGAADACGGRDPGADPVGYERTSRTFDSTSPTPISSLARWSALLAAFGIAVYPSFIHSTGELMSEPPAVLTLPAAILAFLWASDREDAWPWLVPGLLFGLTAMFRPEYLLVAVAFLVFAAIRLYLRLGLRRGLLGTGLALAALLVAIVPWTVRNYVVLERLVPISTGSGKALYVGTYLPADGEYQRVKALLYERFEGKSLAPDSAALNDVNPTPLFDRVANEYKAEHGEPELPRDSALGKVGKEDFNQYFGEDPLGYLGMTARKVGRMWSSGVGAAMGSGPGKVVQVLLVLAGLAGFALLAIRRRWWDLLSLATPIVSVTAVGAISLAAPRRNEVLMTLVFPLAALAVASALAAISSRREWSPQQASSPPN